MFGNGGTPQPVHHVLDEDELENGIDELGVLLYGHEKNAYWYGSRLSLEETRRIAPGSRPTSSTAGRSGPSGASMGWAPASEP
jgi:homospermidine synthase